jgi:putative RNA 2'-phosphotransferase
VSRKSKFLALVLRHNPALIGLSMDRHGWVSVDEFLKNCASHGAPFKYQGKPYTRTELTDIVAKDDKGRFEFDNSKTKIRAVHGHSVDLEMDRPSEVPLSTLYHGTTGRFLDGIFSDGLMPMKRRFVHLSETVEQALNVGGRHGEPLLLVIAAGELHKRGKDFFRSESGVWLTDHVPPEYIQVAERGVSELSGG